MKRTLGHGCIAGGLAFWGAVYCNGPDLSSPPAGGGFGSAATSSGAVGVGGSGVDPGAQASMTRFVLETPSLRALPNPTAASDSGGAAGAAGAPGAPGAAGEFAGEAQGGSAPDVPQTPLPPPGALWAALWDDNLNFEVHGSLLGMPEADDLSLGALHFSDAEREAARAHASDSHGPRTGLDVALVLDTTGSMGDELDYLKQHLGSVWNGIQTRLPRTVQRWALVVYRDEGDNYVSRVSDFTDNRERYEDLLSEQRAEGGGDLPEALDQALLDMHRLSWRTDRETARMALLFTDAPHHADKVERVQLALLDAQQADIHVYPVASSNTDQFSLRTLRNVAQITSGRLVFIPTLEADASLAPQFSCFFVTELRDSLLRIASIELSGNYEPPVTASLVATFGDPEAGRCSEPPATAY